MAEKWQEREYKRDKIIDDAVNAADRIILDGSDGTNEETNYLTGMVAKRFMEKAMIPFHAAIQKKDMEEDDK
ncbi:MAG: hypothetical protein Q8P74_00805 [bacterium]|nr:hypothetical protein [bacterium]